MAESQKIMRDYPDRIPIIVERALSADRSAPQIDRSKFLTPRELTVGQFLHVVRKRVKLNAEQALFIFLDNGLMPPTSALLSAIYQSNRDTDGFLYIKYAGENTFGKGLN